MLLAIAQWMLKLVVVIVDYEFKIQANLACFKQVLQGFFTCLNVIFILLTFFIYYLLLQDILSFIFLACSYAAH